jgi:hypothetical protein
VIGTLIMQPTDARLPLYRWAVGIPERHLDKPFLHGGHFGPECVGYLLQPRNPTARYDEVIGPQKLVQRAYRSGNGASGN